MPGLRRLRDVTSKISGALVGPRDEVSDVTPPPAGAGPAGEPEDAVVPAPQDSPAATPADDLRAPAGVAEPTTEPAPQEDLTVRQTPTAQRPAAETAAAGSDPAETRTDEPDAACAAAVDLARAVAVEMAGDAVGEHLAVESEPAADGFAVTHSFATREAGYVGWRWAVTVARAEGSADVTVDEVVLLPGRGSLLAPSWVPWDQRMQPGDLGPGDLLPPPEGDPRLIASYESVDDEELPFELHRDLGLGRPRVLSTDGRADAAERWYDGDAGPTAPIAKSAPGRCADCGFLTPLAGSLGRVFGACANAMAPDDGRVVALLHGCGAHSEQPTTPGTATATGMALDHEELELVDVSSLPAAAEDEPADIALADVEPADVEAADVEPVEVAPVGTELAAEAPVES